MAEEKKPKKVSVDSVLSKDKDTKPKAKPESKEEKKKKKRMKHTHIEHHDDGSHTIRHTPMGGGDEISYSKPDLDGVHDGLEEHIGEPNEGEEQSEPVSEAAAEPPAEAMAPKPGM